MYMHMYVYICRYAHTYIHIYIYTVWRMHTLTNITNRITINSSKLLWPLPARLSG